MRAWGHLDEKEMLMSEGSTLLQMISRDLSSSPAEGLDIDLPHPHCSKNLFFLKRTSSDSLVAIGYFLDPNKKNHCYRFIATARETLEAIAKGGLSSLYEVAAPGEAHCELISSHLVSWEVTPAWRRGEELPSIPGVKAGETIPPPSLLEVAITFGQKSRYYTLSTVVTLPVSANRLFLELADGGAGHGASARRSATSTEATLSCASTGEFEKKSADHDSP